MNFLEERIQRDGIVKERNVLKVDAFLNHQMDVRLFRQAGSASGTIMAVSKRDRLYK